MTGQICVLEDGRRIRFALKRRQRDPNYLVLFRGPDGLRRERSTRETNQRRASDAAITIIHQEFRPHTDDSTLSWDEALDALTDHLVAANLRRPTIDNYKFTVQTLRKMYPEASGPGDITPAMAERYKAKRLKEGRSPHSVRGDLTALKVVYGKWWGRVGKLMTVNPFAVVERPKAERKPPRIVSHEERLAFTSWLCQRWDGWRLPVLFLEVKALIGCRISELAWAKTENLKEGRLHFLAETTKGRRERALKLLPEIYAELERVGGKTYVFERFSSERREIFRRRGLLRHVATIKPYSPAIFKDWLENELSRYFQKHPEAKRFKLHNFRGTAMSRARQAGVSYDDASVAFGCHPETMRHHYVSVDETPISDNVMQAIQFGFGSTSDGSPGNHSDEKSREI